MTTLRCKDESPPANDSADWFSLTFRTAVPEAPANLGLCETKLTPDTVFPERRVTEWLPPADPQPPTRIVSETAAPSPLGFAPPTGFPSIPGYDILSELGRGGMGVVYQARDTHLNRLVALKLILAGPGVGTEAHLRFQREAEVLAALHHPNIVQVHEVGQAEGTPFCALEYLPSGSLLAKLLRAPMPARESAAVVGVVARAVHHAHERGILHRDLKPSNILLDADGTPKVGDFGLAKRVGEEHTHSGAVLGTPSYMAPEQAQGNLKAVGPAADVYGLGAVLYDLLTGRPPFRSDTALATLHQVLSDDPVPPVRLNSGVPRDLETVCLRCLRKDPKRRYASAAELADDLRRFLDGEPIRARRVGPGERAVKWTRRRPAAAGLVALAALTAAGLLAGGAWYARHEADRAAEAQRLHEEARREQRRAADNFRLARAAVEEMLTRVAREKLAHTPHAERVRRELLEKALRFYEEFAARDSGSDPELRREAARALVRVGDIRALLGDATAAEAAYRPGIALLAALADEFPDDPAPREDLAAGCNNLGNLLRDAARHDEAEGAYRRAAELRQALHDAAPAADARRELAVCLANLGALRHRQGRLDEAERDVRRALELLDGADEAESLQERARVLNNLARLLAETGRVTGATEVARDACAVLGRLAKERPDVPDHRQELAAAHQQLGDLLRDADPAAAEKAYDEAVRHRAALAADFPAVPAYRQELAATHNGRALLFRAAGRGDAADDAERQALALKEKLAADQPTAAAYRRDLAGTYNNRGIALQLRNRRADAEEAYRKSLSLFGALAADHPGLPEYPREQARVRLNLAALLAADRPDEAEAECRAALALLARLVSDFPAAPEHRQERGRALGTLATLLETQKQVTGAAEVSEQCVEEFARLADEFPAVVDYRQQLAEARLNLALVQRSAGAAEAGEQSCRAALDLFARLARDFSDVPAHRQALARCRH
jgi:tetratricopeptide (TPR) repeat protein